MHVELHAKCPSLASSFNGMCHQILVKFPSIRFNEALFTGPQTDRQVSHITVYMITWKHFTFS
jgi:hypothetical protein